MGKTITLQSARMPGEVLHFTGKSVREVVERAAASAEAESKKISLKWIRLLQEDLYESKISDLEAMHCRWTEVEASKSDARGICFTYGILDECKFDDTDLRDILSVRTEFLRCFMRNADLSDGRLEKSSFHRLNADGAHFHRVKARRTTWNACELVGTDWEGADLTEAVSMGGTDWTRANLRDATLVHFDGRGGCFDSVDFTGSTRFGAQWVGASMEGVKGIELHETTPLAMLLDQPGKIRAYISAKYGSEIEKGRILTASGDDAISVVTRNVVREMESVKDEENDFGFVYENKPVDLYLVEFEAEDIFEIPFGSAGQFLVNKCIVVDRIL